MTAHFSVFKEDGKILFDTTRICYGLKKSGYMASVEVWPRKVKPYINTDPNKSSSWKDSTRQGDLLHGFAISGARSPIVFIVGKGALQGIKLVGSSRIFMYSGASAATKYFVFDLMVDSNGKGPYLKTYNDLGIMTFNSFQVPLNVVSAVQAPGPGALDRFGRYFTPYLGGTNVLIRDQSATHDKQSHSFIDLAFTPGIEYAAFLPWSRFCEVLDGSGQIHVQYGMSEGAYGRVGGISFFFAPSGAGAVAHLFAPSYSVNWSFHKLPIERLPVALVITTKNLPFPFG